MRHAIANCVYALIELFLIKEVEHKILGDKRTIFFSFCLSQSDDGRDGTSTPDHNQRGTVMYMYEKKQNTCVDLNSENEQYHVLNLTWLKWV